MEEKETRTPLVVCFIGSILFLLESIYDIIIWTFFDGMIGDMGIFSDLASGLAPIMIALAIIGIILSLFLIGFNIYMFVKGSRRVHYIVILSISGAAFFITSAALALIVLVVGSIVGIVKHRK